MTLVEFPLEAYPVMYKIYWSQELEEDKRIENNREHNSTLIEIFKNYYNIDLDLSTLDSISYIIPLSGWRVIFKIVFLQSDGTTDYLWEYFDNWVSLLNANRY